MPRNASSSEADRTSSPRSVTPARSAHTSSPVAARCNSRVRSRTRRPSASWPHTPSSPSGGRSPTKYPSGSSKAIREGWAPVTSAGVPEAAMRPRCRMASRSARFSASSRWCVVRRTVVPASRRARTRSQVSRRPSASRPVVGSSRNRTSGSPSTASARSRRRRSPPDNCLTRTSARSASPTSASASPAGRAPLTQPAHIRAVSATVSSEGKPPSWSITPVRGRTAARSAYGSWPRTLIRPPSGRASPSSSSTVDVFPAPLVPSSAKTSPRRTWKEIPRTASNSPPYTRRRPVASITCSFVSMSRASPRRGGPGSARCHQCV